MRFLSKTYLLILLFAVCATLTTAGRKTVYDGAGRKTVCDGSGRKTVCDGSATLEADKPSATVPQTF